MAEKEGTRKTSEAKVICQVPDVCKTPVGPATPPVPYQIVGNFKDSDGTSPNVRFCGCPVFMLNKSKITKVTGDEAGTAGGVKSGTCTNIAEPLQGSSTVRSNGNPVVRHEDLFIMNNGNTIGKANFDLGGAPGAKIDKGGKIKGNTNPPISPTAKEIAAAKTGKGFLHQTVGVVKGVGKSLFDMGKGLYGLANFAMSMRDPMKWIDGSNVKTMQTIGKTGAAIANDPSLVVDAVTEPYKQAVANGEYGEAVGRGIVDIGGFFVGGVGEIGKVGETANAIGKTGEVANAIGKTGEAVNAIGKTGEIVEVTGKVGKVSETAAQIGKTAEITEDAGKIGKIAEISETAEKAKTAESIAETANSVGQKSEAILKEGQAAAGFDEAGKGAEIASSAEEAQMASKVESPASAAASEGKTPGKAAKAGEEEYKDGVKVKKKKKSPHKGAAFGEKKAHAKMEELGYERIDKGGPYKPGQQGIDGVYKNTSPPPDYVIMEAKYNTAKLITLKDGTKQMSDKWVFNRLEKAVGTREAENIQLAINNGTAQKWLLNVDKVGNVTGKVLDKAASAIKNVSPF